MKKKLIILLICLVRCTHIDNQNLVIDAKLKQEIMNFIIKNKLNDKCDLHVNFIQHCHNYSTFEIRLATTSKFPYIFTNKINGHCVFYYTGLERYFTLSAPQKSKTINNDCIEFENFCLIVDSLGYFFSIPNIGVYPACQFPNIRDLESKTKQAYDR